MKARIHRGEFVESMATMKEIPETIEAVAAYFNVPKATLSFTEGGFDERQGWNDTYWYVLTNGSCIGMTSKEVLK
jgi:hypothetical protein